jgi:hypothetical protein
MAKRLTVGNALLCDHVVPGENGKHTLINVYPWELFRRAGLDTRYGLALLEWPKYRYLATGPQPSFRSTRCACSVLARPSVLPSNSLPHRGG